MRSTALPGREYAAIRTLRVRADAPVSVVIGHGAVVPTCAYFSCELPATDRRRGMPLCRGHFFLALQWGQPRRSGRSA